MKRTTLFVFLGLAALSGATTRDSFLSVNAIVGITVAPSNPQSFGSATWTITLNPGAYFQYGPDTYDITHVWGFYQLDRSHSFTRTGASQSSWTWKPSTSGGGNMFGWKGSPNKVRMNVGDTKTFTFSGGSGSYETLGFHVTTLQDFPGTPGFKTGNITVDGGTPPVPEPATIGLFAASLGLAARKRRKR